HVSYRTTMLAPPPEPPRRAEPVRVMLPRPVFVPVARLPVPVPVPAPTPVTQEREVRIAAAVPPPAPPVPPAFVAPRLPDPKPVPGLPVPQPPVITNVFAGMTASAEPVPPIRNTEAAGFGDASANRQRGHSGRPDGIGTLGGFDVGSGSG